MDRMELLSTLPNKKSCDKCGSPNNCALEVGKSISACWCVGIGKVDANDLSGSCLCRSCISAKTGVLS